MRAEQCLGVNSQPFLMEDSLQLRKTPSNKSLHTFYEFSQTRTLYIPHVYSLIFNAYAREMQCLRFVCKREWKSILPTKRSCIWMGVHKGIVFFPWPNHLPVANKQYHPFMYNRYVSFKVIKEGHSIINFLDTRDADLYTTGEYQ